MTAIRINLFDGIYPSVSARVLPDNAGQVNHNLLNRTGEFRPLKTDAVAAAAPSGSKTIYRLHRTADGSFNDNMAIGWRTNLLPLNVAKGQVNDDKTERTYVTAFDGSLPMHAIDATGATRLAGVPKPAVPPTPTVTVVDELTYDERSAGYAEAREKAISALQDNLVEGWLGIPSPGTGTPGVVDIIPTYGPYRDQARVARLFTLSGPSGVISDAFSSDPPDSFSWVLDPALKGQEVPPLTNPPAWAGANWHYAVTLHAYGLTYSLNASAAEAALSSITLPNGAALFSPAESASLVSAAVAALDPTEGVAAAKIEALQAKYREVTALLKGGSRASLAASMTAFYAKPEITGLIDKAFNTFAEETFRAAQHLALMPPPQTNIDAGGP